MKLKKLNSNREVSVSIARWRMDWDKPCRSKFQYHVKQWLRKFWQEHICMEEFRIPGSKLRCDIFNLTKRAVVEINGIQHSEYSPHFHNGSRATFLAQIKRDEDKRRWAESNGILFIEIEPDDLPLTQDFFRREYDFNLL